MKISDISKDRLVFMFDDFRQDTAESMIKDLIELDSKSNEDIYILINSYGGAVYSLFSILDTIDGLKSNVNTICLGEADSCAAILLSYGKKRYIGSKSRAMIHEVSAFTWGKISEMEDELVLVKEVNDKLINILSSKTGKTEEYLQKVMKKDTFLSSKEALRLGLVDEVLEDREVEDYLTNSFSLKDKVLNIFKNNKGRDALVFETLVSRVKKEENKKGVDFMDKESLINELKSHGIDVDALKSEKLKTEQNFALLANELEALKLENKSYKESVEKEKINNLLSEMIDKGVSTQDLNETYREMFNTIGVEKAKEFSNKLKPIVKTAPRSSSPDDNNEENLTTSELLDKKVKAYMSKTGETNYINALNKVERGEQ